jgi:hypothetical protein
MDGCVFERVRAARLGVSKLPKRRRKRSFANKTPSRFPYDRVSKTRNNMNSALPTPWHPPANGTKSIFYLLSSYSPLPIFVFSPPVAEHPSFLARAAGQVWSVLGLQKVRGKKELEEEDSGAKQSQPRTEASQPRGGSISLASLQTINSMCSPLRCRSPCSQ